MVDVVVSAGVCDEGPATFWTTTKYGQEYSEVIRPAQGSDVGDDLVETIFQFLPGVLKGGGDSSSAASAILQVVVAPGLAAGCNPAQEAAAEASQVIRRNRLWATSWANDPVRNAKTAAEDCSAVVIKLDAIREHLVGSPNRLFVLRLIRGAVAYHRDRADAAVKKHALAGAGDRRLAGEGDCER